MIDLNGSLNPALMAMQATTKRQRVISNNIANAATPGYVAKSISFSDLLNEMNNPFQTKLAQKMGTMTEDAISTGAPVSLQKEMIEMQKNMLFYSMASRRASSFFTNMRTAIQTGR